VEIGTNVADGLRMMPELLVSEKVFLIRAKLAKICNQKVMR